MVGPQRALIGRRTESRAGHRARDIQLVLHLVLSYARLLLLRLLMAMMTNTYTTVRLLATRHWRLQFARCVLQMEMVAGSKELTRQAAITRL